jgi:hypothetical protein
VNEFQEQFESQTAFDITVGPRSCKILMNIFYANLLVISSKKIIIFGKAIADQMSQKPFLFTISDINFHIITHLLNDLINEPYYFALLLHQEVDFFCQNFETLTAHGNEEVKERFRRVFEIIEWKLEIPLMRESLIISIVLPAPIFTPHKALKRHRCALHLAQCLEELNKKPSFPHEDEI